MEVPSLRDIFWAHRGLLSDKWEQYLPIYESELRPHLEHGVPISLLEIGVLNGGSLEVWHKLLPPPFTCGGTGYRRAMPRAQAQ